MPESLIHDNLDDLGLEKGELRKPKNEEKQKKQQKLASQQKAFIRDIQLILAICLDLMPQASQDYTERIESPQPLSSIIQNVWELTDYYTQTVLSNESRSSRETGGDQADVSPQNQSSENKSKT